MKYVHSWWQHETKQRNINNVKSHTMPPDMIIIKTEYGADMGNEKKLT
jgi:hypothetical protein